ncbi:MAG: HAD-IA family hydrolase [Fuerstiella sp.]|nr:HAD-IA family hydrolase [Fuerstiella sp.]
MAKSVHEKSVHNDEVSVLHGVAAVLFDAVGTLIYPTPSVAEAYRSAISRHCGVDVDLDRVNAVVRDSLTARSTGEDLSTCEQAEHEFWAYLIRELCPGSNGFQACFDDLFAHFARPESWRCFSDVAKLVGDLKRAGLKVAIASNFDLRLHSVCDGLQEIADIDCRVISSVAGWRKPAAEFFQAATRELEVSAGQTLMVGDDLANDVEGATAAGMRAAWICRSSAIREDTALPESVLQLSSLQQLPELLSSSSCKGQ